MVEIEREREKNATARERQTDSDRQREARDMEKTPYSKSSRRFLYLCPAATVGEGNCPTGKKEKKFKTKQKNKCKRRKKGKQFYDQKL